MSTSVFVESIATIKLMQPENDQYGFIFDQGKQHQPRSFQPQSKSSKILISIGFVAGVIILAIVGFSYVLSLGKANNTDLIAVRAHQIELLRVIELGQKDVTDINLRNRIASMQASITSDAYAIDNLLSKRKVEADKTLLAAEKDDDTDAELASALQNSGFNEVLLNKIEELSNNYYGALKDAKLDVASKTETEILDKAIQNLELSAEQ